MPDSEYSVSLSDGEVRAWLEQGEVHIKAVDRHGDPVELSCPEVKELANALTIFFERIEQR